MKKSLFLLLVLLALVDMDSALAVSKRIEFAENNPISDLLCNIFGTTQGLIGRTIVIFVIVITGASFLLGKGSWGALIGIALGVVVMFSSENLVGKFTGGKGYGGCSCKYNISGEYCSSSTD